MLIMKIISYTWAIISSFFKSWKRVIEDDIALQIEQYCRAERLAPSDTSREYLLEASVMLPRDNIHGIQRSSVEYRLLAKNYCKLPFPQHIRAFVLDSVEDEFPTKLNKYPELLNETASYHKEIRRLNMMNQNKAVQSSNWKTIQEGNIRVHRMS